MTETDVVADLPEGWAWTSLGHLIQSSLNGYGKRSQDAGEPAIVLRLADILNQEVSLESTRRVNATAEEIEKYRLLPDDLLTIRVNGSADLVGRLVRFRVADVPILFCDHFIRVRMASGIISEFVRLYGNAPAFRWYVDTNKVSSAGQNTISQATLVQAAIPLPPLAEQKRIVAKVETLLARVNAARQRLAKVPGLLKRFRQSVLAAACSGRLTKDWRENYHVTESAQDLCNIIRSAKAKGYVTPNPDAQMEFPSSWELVSVDEITNTITSGSRDWKQYYTDNGSGTFIMAQNIRPMKFDRSYRLAVNPPENDRDRTRSQVRKGDVLVTIVGANTGDVCRVAEDVEQHYVCQSVALMRPVLEETAAYLELFLNSPHHGKSQYENWIYGEGRPHISFDHLRATAIALPPLPEQHEIVRRVEALLARADRIEKRLATATRRVETLTQAILAQAFRGELVPTEAELARREGRDYEPASALLERIRAERQGQPEPKAARKKGTAPSK